MNIPDSGCRAAFRGLTLQSYTAEQLAGRVVRALDSGCGLRVAFVNPHTFNIISGSDRQLLRDLTEMDVVAADGIGVVWAVDLLTRVRIRRLSFDLLAPEFFGAMSARRAPVFLVGGMEGVARRAADVIERAHPGLRVVGTHHGWIDDQDLPHLAQRLREARARVVLLGAGSPRQERLAVELGRLLPAGVFITCGGYFDQVLFPSAYYPNWAYPLRLNWVVRLYREPRRLWRRYLLGNPRFVIDTVLWALRGRG